VIYTVAFKIHIFISAITLLAGLSTVTFSIHGWSRNREFTRKDSSLSFLFSVSLYLQLILGFMIYVTLRSSLEGPLWAVPNTENDASLRFWAIEHIALMILALFLTQLGRIFVKRTSKSIMKFKASLFYNGTSLVLILFSISIALIFR
jgi:hypothetical protein